MSTKNSKKKNKIIKELKPEILEKLKKDPEIVKKKARPSSKFIMKRVIRISVWVILLGTFSFMAFKIFYGDHQKKIADGKAQEFFAALDKKDYAAAYNDLGGAIKKDHTVESFKLNTQVMRDPLGKFISRELDTMETVKFKDNLYFTLVYFSNFSDDPKAKEEIVIVKKKSGELVVGDYVVHSDLLLRY